MEKKFQYSKIITVITCILFVVFTMIALFLNVDSSVAMTAIGCAGGVFGSSVIFYLRKSQQENTYKIRISSYEESVKQRLYFNEQMMILKKKYDMTDEDVDNIENQSDMDDMMNDAFSSMKNGIDEAEADSSTPIDIQTY